VSADVRYEALPLWPDEPIDEYLAALDHHREDAEDDPGDGDHLYVRDAWSRIRRGRAPCTNLPDIAEYRAA
jgi:hypothetical protein